MRLHPAMKSGERKVIPFRSATMSTQIVAQVRDALFARELRPGDFLGTEKDLAGRFGVSRIVARDRTRQVETGQRGSQDRGGDEGRVEGPGPLRSLACVADHQEHPDGPDEHERRQGRDGEPDDDVRVSRGPGTRGHLRSCIGTDPAVPEGLRTRADAYGRPGGRVG